MRGDGGPRVARPTLQSGLARDLSSLEAKFVVALGNRGWALLKLGRRADAERDFRAALALRPDFRPAVDGLNALRDQQ